MQRFEEPVQNLRGDVLTLCPMQVLVAGTNTPATIFADAAGQTVITSPSTDKTGVFSFYAPNGRYDIYAIVNGQRLGHKLDCLLDDPADANADQTAAIATAQTTANTAQTAANAAQADANALQLADYAALRAYTGPRKSVYVIATGIAGMFVRDDSDTTTADNGGTVIVAGNGKRWKRPHSDVVNVEWFGADPTGATDSTTAVNNMVDYLAALGGGTGRAVGSFMVKNLEIAVPRVIIEGETGGFSYERITDISKVGTRFFPASDATWVIRFKGTATGTAAQGSGLRNAAVIDTAPGAHQYGLIEDCAGTLIENVTVQDFQYVHVMPAAVNANVHRRVARLGATKVGLLVSEFQAKGYMHPDIPDIPDIGNTVFFSSGGVIRQNEWGVMIRDAIGASMGDTVIESNRQAGVHIYRVDVSTVRALKFGKVHFENNYDGITADKSVYSITGNRAFLIGNSATYIPWTAAEQAGYQLVFDSQTRTGTGGADNLDFDGCEFNCNNPYQRDILQLSGTSFEFNRANFGGTGDDDNRVLCTADAKGTLFWEPSWKNDPTADVPSLVANFGANLGTRGTLIRTGGRAGELGGLYTDAGVFGGVFHFRDLDPSDPRRTNPRCNDDYHEVDGFTIPWRTGSAFPFTVSNPANTATKDGRKVQGECKCTLTVTSATSAADTIFSGDFLPFQCATVGHLVGRVYIEPVSGGATVLNDEASLRMTSLASVVSVKNVFPALVVGMVFNVYVFFGYTTVT